MAGRKEMRSSCTAEVELASIRKKALADRAIELLMHRSQELTPEVLAYFAAQGVYLTADLLYPVIFRILDPETRRPQIPVDYMHLHEMLTKLLHTEMEGHFLHYVSEVDGSLLLLVLVQKKSTGLESQMEGHEEICDACRHVTAEFERITGLPLFAFLSFGVENLMRMAEQYANMQDIIEYFYFKGEFPEFLDHAQMMDPLERRTSQNPQFDDARRVSGLAREMALALKALSQEELEKSKNALYDEIFNTRTCAKHIVMYKLFSYFNALLTELGDSGVIDQSYISRNNIYRRLTEAQSEQTFRENFDSFIQSIYLFFSQKATAAGNLSAADRSAIIRNWIDENLQNPTLSVSSCADAFHISPSLLSAMFKNAFSLSPHTYISQQRISLVKTELAQTDHTLEEICSRTGFSSITTMQRTFRKFEKMSMGQYRKYCHEFLRSSGQGKT